MATFDKAIRSRSPVAEVFRAKGVEGLKLMWSDESVIQFLDYCVATAISAPGLAKPRELEEILVECGSAWKVGTRRGYPGLERRVPLGVQEAADNVMANTSHAGDILSEAWHAAFGVNPDPSKAYDRALKAVEAAMKQRVSPTDSMATLTKMRNVVRDQKNWTLPFDGEDAVTPNPAVLVGMLNMLIAGQVGRHAHDGPLPVPTQEAAEAAVLLAVPLVQWFTSGAAARRP